MRMVACSVASSGTCSLPFSRVHNRSRRHVAFLHQCNFEVADANLVIRLVKEPVADWNSLPAVTSKELKARELRAVIVGADRSQPEGEAMGVPARPGNGRNRPETSGRDASRASRAPEHGSGGLEDGHDRVKGALNPGLASLAYELD